jgi:hypothetical protein
MIAFIKRLFGRVHYNWFALYCDQLERADQAERFKRLAEQRVDTLVHELQYVRELMAPLGLQILRGQTAGEEIGTNDAPISLPPLEYAMALAYLQLNARLSQNEIDLMRVHQPSYLWRGRVITKRGIQS